MEYLYKEQHSLRDLVFGQAKINESLNKKLAANDKILESINAKVETLSSAIRNQLSFNKMIETQLAQAVGVYRQACSGIPLAVGFVGRDRRL